ALAKNPQTLCRNTDAAFALSVLIYAVAARVSCARSGGGGRLRLAGVQLHSARVMADSDSSDHARRLHFFRSRIARGCATNDDRRRVRLDELHHAADVAVVGHVL